MIPSTAMTIKGLMTKGPSPISMTNGCPSIKFLPYRIPTSTTGNRTMAILYKAPTGSLSATLKSLHGHAPVKKAGKFDLAAFQASKAELFRCVEGFSLNKMESRARLTLGGVKSVRSCSGSCVEESANRRLGENSSSSSSVWGDCRVCNDDHARLLSTCRVKAPTDVCRQRETADIQSIAVRFMLVLFFQRNLTFRAVFQ